MKSRILVIEKTPDISDVMRIYLEHYYYIAYSPSHVDALHKIEKDEHIKLIIYNNDPPEMDGIEFVKDIRKKRIQTPFVLASDDIDDKAEVEIIKSTLFIEEPIKIDPLLQIIEVLVPKDFPKEKERRKFPRVNINKEALVFSESKGKEISGEIINISLGGAKLKLNDLIDHLDEHIIKITLGNLNISIDNVNTVYTYKQDKDTVLGLEFNELNEETHVAIENLIRNIISNSIIINGTI